VIAPSERPRSKRAGPRASKTGSAREQNKERAHARFVRHNHSVRYEIRAAVTSDLDQLFGLARFLNTVNLPDDRAAIARILELSERSFRAEIADPREREFVFLLCDREQQRAIGTSMVIAQLGRPGEPYIYLDVDREERYSATLQKHFVHQVLSVRYVYDGPTEIGGLVVHPDYRNSPEKLGSLISFVRFLYIAQARSDFQDELLAELLPPLEPDGTSHLWEALGRHFTEMSYSEADQLSKRNKEFIRGLFPQGEIYASLLPERAQSVIGVVGNETRGVEKMLRRIGFRYAQRVDPFDGGPHFVAPTDEVAPVRTTRRVELEQDPAIRLTEPYLLARRSKEAPYFVAVPAIGAFRDARTLIVAPDTLQRFAALPAGSTWALPLGLAATS
jgi:arginine N-succinyltransferase